MSPRRVARATTLGPVPAVHADQQVVDDVLHRLLRVAEALGDLAGVLALGQQPEDAELPARKTIGADSPATAPACTDEVGQHRDGKRPVPPGHRPEAVQERLRGDVRTDQRTGHPRLHRLDEQFVVRGAGDGDQARVAVAGETDRLAQPRRLKLEHEDVGPSEIRSGRERGTLAGEEVSG